MSDFYYTFWQSNKIAYPSKRYVLIFDKYRNVGRNPSVTQYDSLDELHEETKLLNEYYKDTPRPIISQSSKNIKYEFPNDEYFWGYVVLDFKLHKVIEIGNDGIVVYYQFCHTNINKLTIDNRIKDYFFRSDTEVPKNYEWNGYEYEGWLQFRWGDGKNAINHINKKPELPGHIEYVEVFNEALNKNTVKKVRVVDVDWNDPLPKRIKGIYYRRPNNEPVKFPDDFGFENDYSMWPWSLSEEIAKDEYIDNGNTLDKKESTSSIADILGDNNPLIKLKNQLENK